MEDGNGAFRVRGTNKLCSTTVLPGSSFGLHAYIGVVVVCLTSNKGDFRPWIRTGARILRLAASADAAAHVRESDSLSKDENCSDDEKDANDETGREMEVEEEVRADRTEDDGDSLREPAHDVIGILDGHCHQQPARHIHHDDSGCDAVEAMEPAMGCA